MNIIKKNQFIILLTIMSLFSITSLSTTLCYKVKLDNYNKDNINEKTYIENDEYIVTWCVGHLVNMCYPEVYDEN